MDFLADPQIWASLLTLTALEIVLGIDNVIFIAILAVGLVSGFIPALKAEKLEVIEALRSE